MQCESSREKPIVMVTERGGKLVGIAKPGRRVSCNEDVQSMIEQRQKAGGKGRNASGKIPM